MNNLPGLDFELGEAVDALRDELVQATTRK